MRLDIKGSDINYIDNPNNYDYSLVKLPLKRLFNHIDFPVGFKHDGVTIDVDKILQW